MISEYIINKLLSYYKKINLFTYFRRIYLIENNVFSLPRLPCVALLVPTTNIYSPSILMTASFYVMRAQ